MMKKWVSAVMTIVACMALLAGCGVAAQTEPRPSGDAEITTAPSGEGGAASASPGESASVGEVETTTVSPLHVEGTKLLDSAGKPIQLRGVSTHGIAWYPQYVNADLFANLKHDWGINAVRIAMYCAESGGYCTDGDKEQLKKTVRDGIDAAVEDDMYVIVDWHTLSDNDPNMHIDEAKEFFGEIADEYAGVPNVLYEICNEPNGGTTWAQVKRYAEQVIPVVRSRAHDAVVLVGTPNWCQDIEAATADPLDVDNVMYTVHFYAAEHGRWLRDKVVAAVKAGTPVFVSEFGATAADGDGAVDARAADAWLDMLDEYGISYIIWNLSDKHEGSALFATNEARDPIESDLSAEGKWYRQYLREHR
ncbi:endo-1,4-beta-glucanase [Bifidobacterium italicum]|uniref:cellulase n=1 Tax=Bifidobacterium italicum TaxID=1960968 RepID=A0A2A2EEU5_9BIFI|nr:glycoside hydrolase family 5 protein [Bifidobacterium italicum]PAU67563.1 endo-1,4-beta-glucanase [Bifidobacterium italicum]